MFESVDIHSAVAVYVQIENQVQYAIASGKLKPGDRLPSMKALSEQLDLNPNTVLKAYRDLEIMGYVYTRRGMGVFIREDVQEKGRGDSLKKLVTRVFEVISEAKAAGFTHEEVMAIVKKDLRG